MSLPSFARRSLLPLSVVVLGTAVLGQSYILSWITGIAAGGEFDGLPEASGGNPTGDVTLQAFLDYNCPICKQSAEDLRRFVEDDGGIRLVYRDWPILGATSILAAKLALAASFQGRYETAHRALMGLRGGRLSRERMDAALEASGVDTTRLRRDLSDRQDEISRILAHNTIEAANLGFAGTPAYLIDRIRAHSLDRAGFRRVVDEIRTRRRQTAAPEETPEQRGAAGVRPGDPAARESGAR